jgi:hypothetical protein
LEGIDLFGNLKGNYEVKKGLPGMKRDINEKLTYYLDDNKTRQFFGISSDYFVWKNHFIFTHFHWEPQIKYNKDVIRIKHHLFKGNGDILNNYINLKPEMFPNSAIYQLQVTLVSTYGMVIAFNLVNKTQIWVTDCHITNFLNDDTIFNVKAHWNKGDKLLFLIDTFSKEITYVINGKQVNCFNFLQNEEPLIVQIRLAKEKLIYLQYFGNILDNNIKFLSI